MKIILIHPHDIHSVLEPWTVRIVSIATELKKAGHQVRLVYFPVRWHRGIRPCEFEGITVIPLSRRIGPLTFLRNIAKVYRISSDVDIIHFQKCFHWASIPALFAAYLRDIPVHYDWDDWEEKIFIASNKKPFLPVVIFIRLLEKYIPKLVDTVSVSSDKLKQLCLNSGVRKEMVFIASVGADLDKFNPAICSNGVRKKYGLDNDLLIFYHGQLHGAQYARLFIKAAKYIQDEYPQVNFMLVGGGSGLGELKRYSQELSLNNFIFTGSIRHSEIPNYIASADICVACFEDNDITRCKSPLKIAEYLAMGKPIVVSSVGEVRRMVGEAGIFTEAADAQSLSRGIITLLKDRDLREKMARIARERAENKFNSSITARNMLAAYQKALNG